MTRTGKSWSMCHRPELYKRITRHVELHNLRKRSRNSPYFKWLVENQYKVVLAEPVPELPSAQIFPQAEVMSRFGGFYTNSVSWMISLALLENVDVIGLWGVDMAAGTEYEYQLPSARYQH